MLTKFRVGFIFMVVALAASPGIFGNDMSKKYNKDELKGILTPLQFKVTQEEGTEPPFKNEYWDNKDVGLYVDVVSGEPLFSSLDKYKSGTGWPSFTKPVDEKHITLHKDRKLWSVRTEVRSAQANSHLGHVFDDGPAPTGKRYCLNSAALRFIPVAELKNAGYEQFLPLFSEAETPEKVEEKAMETITFAGGCFWCMEPPFERLEGVTSVVSGYMGGQKKNPTYKEVSSGSTGYAEVVQVTYDPAKISIEELLGVFWVNVDPTDGGGQFADRGTQYRTGIFYHSDAQKKAAEKSKGDLEKTGRFQSKIVSEITAASDFYPAEDYHQDYYKENPLRYKFYRQNSGRDQFLEKHWQKK